MSIARNLEIDTSPLLAWIFSAWPTARVYAPRETSIMMHAQIFLDTEYAVNRLGIPEPPAQNVAQITNFDLIFVPLLAFDSAGHRVGYGGGYYDRFLAGQAKAFKVGLAYESSRLSRIIDADIHDVALDRVITETKMHRFA
jgi:5-formyltetrahydrofolate cyclo-ligase